MKRLGVGVLRDYNKLKPETQGKNILAWTPVVAEILDGYCRFDRQDVSTSHILMPLSDDVLVCAILVSYLPTCNQLVIARSAC